MLITDRLRSGELGKKVGTIRNVKISNVTITDVVAGKNHGPAHAATISGRPESRLENIVLENVKITYQGGGKAEDAAVVPPYPKDYSPRSLGPRPTSGVYVRHVKGLTFGNVTFDFEATGPNSPLVVFDVDDSELYGFKTNLAEGVGPAKFDQVSGAVIRSSPVLHGVKAARAEAT